MVKWNVRGKRLGRDVKSQRGQVVCGRTPPVEDALVWSALQMNALKRRWLTLDPHRLLCCGTRAGALTSDPIRYQETLLSSSGYLASSFASRALWLRRVWRTPFLRRDRHYPAKHTGWEQDQKQHDELSVLDGSSGRPLGRKSPSRIAKIHKQLHWVRRINAGIV